MFCNQAVKVLSASALYAAALLGASWAGARINFDVDIEYGYQDDFEVGTLIFAREALGLGGRPDEQGFYTITSPDLDTEVSLGKLAAYVVANNAIYVRYDASGNLKLRETAPVLVLSQGGMSFNINPESGLGSDFFLYKIPAENAFTSELSLELDFQTNLKLSDGRNGRLMVRIYEGSGLNAIQERERFELKRREVTAARVANSIGVEFEPGNTATADAATSFAKFLNGEDTVALGSLAVGVQNDELLDSSGMPINFISDPSILMGRSSTVSFSGAAGFAFADFTLAEGRGCAGAKTSLHYRGSQVTKAGPAYASLAIGEKTLCVTAREASEDVQASSIPEATYSATVAFSDARAWHLLPGPAHQANFGRIKRNGTTVQLPLLTTHENYNDRIIIVNRSNLLANYDLTFHPEKGARAIRRAKASGTLDGKTTTVFRARDAVTLDGGFRTAASLSIGLSRDQVEVMTQRVNLGDGSTDSMHHASQPEEN